MTAVFGIPYDYTSGSRPGAPNYDPAETTIRLAAQALFQFLVERTPAAGGR
jgi:hypothetical protein